MNKNQPKNWPNQKHNFSHIAYYLDNFNSQDCTPQTVKQISRLLILAATLAVKVQKTAALLWHL